MKKLTFLLFILFCCKSYKILAQSNAKLLCNAGWKKASFTVYPAMQYWTNGKVESDLFKSERACTKDDYYIYNTNGTYQLLDGEIRCMHEQSDVVSNGKWTFQKDDNTILNIIKKNTQGTLQKKIIMLTENTFSFTYSITKNEVLYTFTETFEAIK
jgi:hypothetical protein